MRLRGLALASGMIIAVGGSAVQAAELQYGRAGIPPKLPDLGPAGNGRRLFVELNCVLCHGARAGGQFGPNIQQAELGDVSEALKQGEPEAGMPSFAKYVTATDIKNITAYLGSIGSSNEPMWFDWWVPHPKI